MNLMVNAASMIANRFRRLADGIYDPSSGSTKHAHYRDFGYPEHLSFAQLYQMYLRNGLAKAAVEKTILKTWQDYPFLAENDDGIETPLEADIRQRFTDLRIWQHLSEADRRGMVGNYAGVILRLADGKKFDQPVDRVPGGLMGLVEVIPAWEGQLTVSSWDTDELSETYGKPQLFQFNEAQIDRQNGQPRSFIVHPDRVIIWSRDGTVHCRSALEAGYNDLVDLEKIKGAGGEGFWKNAKSAPVFEIDKDAKIAEMAKAMGVKPDDIADAMDEQVADWQRGFDQLLMLQGMQAKTLQVNLPSPEHFWAAPLQSFAASMNIPLKILVGNQTGERASAEDAEDWAQTNMSRRTELVIPNIMEMVNRLERFGILQERDWFVNWNDLTEASMGEKVDRASKMADVNQKMAQSEIVFTGDEIRAAVDLEPLSDAEKFRDEVDPAEEAAAVTPPAQQPEE
jgi:uncharacterized protein